jgi:hypothetical protein
VFFLIAFPLHQQGIDSIVDKLHSLLGLVILAWINRHKDKKADCLFPFKISLQENLSAFICPLPSVTNSFIDNPTRVAIKFKMRLQKISVSKSLRIFILDGPESSVKSWQHGQVRFAAVSTPCPSKGGANN